MNERYSSSTLGRPYAIADQDIEINLPIEASYGDLQDLEINHSNLEEIRAHDFAKPNELSVFLFVVGLRKIQSTNRMAFYESSDHLLKPTFRDLFSSASGLIMSRVHGRLGELEEWLASAPVFSLPRTTYHLVDWYSFLVEKEKLSVVRAAMARLSQLKAHSPKKLLELCSMSSVIVIELFSRLFRSQQILPTRNYFQVLFVSGLSLMFCEFVQPKKLTTQDAAAQNVATETIAQEPSQRVAEALHLCRQVLIQLSKDMPDSRTFYVLFEVLRKRVAPQVASTADQVWSTAGDVAQASHQAESYTASYQHGLNNPFAERSSCHSSGDNIPSTSFGPGVTRRNVQLPLPNLQGDVSMSNPISTVPDAIGTNNEMFGDHSPFGQSQTLPRTLFNLRSNEPNSPSFQPAQVHDEDQTAPGAVQPGYSLDEDVWSAFLSEEVIERMVADVGDYVWDQPAADSNIWNTFELSF